MIRFSELLDIYRIRKAKFCVIWIVNVKSVVKILNHLFSQFYSVPCLCQSTFNDLFLDWISSL